MNKIRLASGAVIFGAGLLLEYVFHGNPYAVLAVFLTGYALLGSPVILYAIKNIAKGQVFDENFLMCVATIGAFATGNYPEAVGVMLFWQIGEYFQDLAVMRSRKSIADLMDIRPDYANLQTGNEIRKVAPETVRAGDVIVVKPGEKIPLDGVVTGGESMLDTAALTGEPVPRRAAVSDAALSGCVNLSGVLTIRVTKTFGESTVSKIIDLVENARDKKAPTENFITKFARVYTPVVVAAAACFAFVPPLALMASGVPFGQSFPDWLYRALIFLVISCPCALVISIPLGFYGGIGGASRKGILVKGGNYLEALGNLEIVVFDKTGTLTKGAFEVTKILPADGFSKEALLDLAAYAEAFSNHPIALSVMKAYGRETDRSRITDYAEIPGQGVRATVGGKKVLAGNHKLMQAYQISFTETGGAGTRVYVSEDGAFVGCIVISDEIKADSAAAIAGLKAVGVRKTVMLSGDDPVIAEAIAKELGLDEAYAGLLPAQKVEQVELLNRLKSPKGKLAFVGDGINDAPVLAGADVGIAMGGLGSDAAIEAADVVLMTDEPSKVTEAIEIAKFTRRIVWQNIIFALGVKGLFLLLAAFGAANMWEAVFADVGVALLAVLNAMRAMRMKP